MNFFVPFVSFVPSWWMKKTMGSNLDVLARQHDLPWTPCNALYTLARHQPVRRRKR